MASNVTAPTREYPVIDTVEALQQRMKEMRKAQQEFATYTSTTPTATPRPAASSRRTAPTASKRLPSRSA